MRRNWTSVVKLFHIFYHYLAFQSFEGPGGSMSQVVGLPNNSYKPITNTAWVRARLCRLQTGCTRLAVTSDKVYQLLAHGRWFSPGTPASSTTKIGRHDIAEILLKVALKHQKSINQFNILTLSVPDEGLSRSTSCTLNQISTFFTDLEINIIH